MARYKIFQLLVLVYGFAALAAAIALGNIVSASPRADIFRTLLVFALFGGSVHFGVVALRQRARSLGIVFAAAAFFEFVLAFGIDAFEPSAMTTTVYSFVIPTYLIATAVSMFFTEAQKGYRGPAPTYG